VKSNCEAFLNFHRFPLYGYINLRLIRFKSAGA
jgi:hypothetical protein